jgi:hypothetical protein
MLYYKLKKINKNHKNNNTLLKNKENNRDKVNKECDSETKFIKDEISENNKDSFANCNDENFVLKKISFKYEIIPICENIHLETRHGSMSEGFIKFRILFG